LIALSPRVLYEDLPHLFSGQTKKLSAVSPVDLLQVHQADERFVYQNRGVPVRLALTSEKGTGGTTQFAVNKHSKPMKCFFISRTPLLQ
jgi:hypothetical protein